MCLFFRIFMQHQCCWHCRSINLFCNKHCHTVFCRCTFWYHSGLYFPIFIHFTYPQFYQHSIHTHVDNCELIHRVDFLQAAYSKKFVAISLCFSIFFAADCAIWQTCFFIILSSVCCSMLQIRIFRFKRTYILLLSRILFCIFLSLKSKIQRLSAMQIL